MTAMSSIWLFVVSKAPPESCHGSALLPSGRRKTSTAAYPPAPLVWLAQAPSVQISYVGPLGKAAMPAVCRNGVDNALIQVQVGTPVHNTAVAVGWFLETVSPGRQPLREPGGESLP